jgi:hypothetical protein
MSSGMLPEEGAPVGGLSCGFVVGGFTGFFPLAGGVTGATCTPPAATLADGDAGAEDAEEGDVASAVLSELGTADTALALTLGPTLLPLAPFPVAGPSTGLVTEPLTPRPRSVKNAAPPIPTTRTRMAAAMPSAPMTTPRLEACWCRRSGIVVEGGVPDARLCPVDD